MHSSQTFTSVLDFQKWKSSQKKISMLSVYDTLFGRLAVESGVNSLLIGDSVAMVLYGHDSTLSATVEMIAAHVAAVRRSSKDIFLVADLPFGSYRKGCEAALASVEILVRAGANAVKLEGVRGNEKIITHIVESGIPVMGHLGLTPQSVLAFGGYKVQGRTSQAATRLLEDARSLQQLGVFSLVLECVPRPLAKEITQNLSIPVIGIGAGNDVDGQILVGHDLLGLSLQSPARFVRRYAEGNAILANAFTRFVEDTRMNQFPDESESYL